MSVDSERQAEIDTLYEKLSGLSHYQLLGLKSYASIAEIRKAYFTFSKLYHPDTLFEQELGHYKAKMGAIFARMTEAYNVLSDPDARSEYDRKLRLALEIQFQGDLGAAGSPSGEGIKKPIDREAIAKRAAGRIRRLGARVQTPMGSGESFQSPKNVKK